MMRRLFHSPGVKLIGEQRDNPELSLFLDFEERLLKISPQIEKRTLISASVGKYFVFISF